MSSNVDRKRGGFGARAHRKSGGSRKISPRYDKLSNLTRSDMMYRKGRQNRWSTVFINKLVKIMEFHCKATGKDNPYEIVAGNYKK